MTATTSRLASAGTGHVTQLGVLHSEWIKLRSLRSTWYSLLATFVIIVGLGTLFSALRAHRFHNSDLFNLDPTQASLRGAFLAQLAIGVLGVLVISGEYSTGMIRSSLAAVPHRSPVLAAKSAVFAVLALVVTTAGTFCAFLLGQAALASTHRQANLSTPHALRAVVGTGLYLTLIGLLAVGLGFLIRSTAGAIATLVGIVLVLPLLANALPDPYAGDVTKYLPLSTLNRVMATTHPDSNLLGPWAGLGITALYAAAALIAGLVLLKRRDA
jgi:ABC-type transport system involved in multi-copper enzyme maturation permease subunit